MKPKATVLVVLVSALPFGLFLAACEGLQTEHRIKVEDLAGIWHKVDDGQYLQLNEDETYRVSSYIAGLEEYPSEVGRFQLEETSLTLITSDESPMCRGQQGIYQV